MFTIKSIVILFLLFLGVEVLIRLGFLLMLAGGDWKIIWEAIRDVFKEKFLSKK